MAMPKSLLFTLGLIAAAAAAALTLQRTGPPAGSGQPASPNSESAVSKVIHLTTPAFPAVQAQEKPVLIDFWAPWCGPCRTQGPILETVSEQIGDQAIVAKVNVDEERALAAQFGVEAIPTLVLLKQGKVLNRFVGVQQAPALLEPGGEEGVKGHPERRQQEPPCRLVQRRVEAHLHGSWQSQQVAQGHAPGKGSVGGQPGREVSQSPGHALGVADFHRLFPQELKAHPHIHVPACDPVADEPPAGHFVAHEGRGQKEVHVEPFMIDASDFRSDAKAAALRGAAPVPRHALHKASSSRATWALVMAP